MQQIPFPMPDDVIFEIGDVDAPLDEMPLPDFDDDDREED